MNKIQISIPHFEEETYKGVIIPVTPFHNWEHLFIRILEVNFYFYDIKTFGFCTRDKTVITLLTKSEIDCNYFEKTRIVQLFKNYNLSEKWMRREHVIIQNELSCMGALYEIDYRKKHSLSDLNYKEMRQFRKMQYDWNRIEIDWQENSVVLPLVKNNNTKLVSHLDLIRDKRDQLIQLFYGEAADNIKCNDLYLEKVPCFSLICIPVDSKNHKDIEPAIENFIKAFEGARGFCLSKFKSKYPLSIVTWFSKEEKYERNWITIFTYIKPIYLQYFIDINIIEIELGLKKYINLNYHWSSVAKEMKAQLEVYSIR